jgi:hypothetical protein
MWLHNDKWIEYIEDFPQDTYRFYLHNYPHEPNR